MTAYDLSLLLEDRVPSIKDLGIVFNKNARRFADPKTGRFISTVKTQNIIKEGIEQNREKLQTYAERLSQGKIDIVSFTMGVGQTIKELHIYNTALAKNGRIDQISKAELKVLNTRVKEQLGSTKGFEGEKYGLSELIKDIYKGNVTEAQLKARLSMYADSAEQTQEHIILESKKQTKEYKEALRVMVGDHKTCPECREYASLGWVRLSDVVLPGQKCSCRSNCRCTLKYR